MSSKLAPTKITDSVKTKMGQEKVCSHFKVGYCKYETNVGTNTLRKNVKLNHVIKNANKDTLKHADMAQNVKELMFVSLHIM